MGKWTNFAKQLETKYGANCYTSKLPGYPGFNTPCPDCLCRPAYINIPGAVFCGGKDIYSNDFFCTNCGAIAGTNAYTSIYDWLAPREYATIVSVTQPAQTTQQQVDKEIAELFDRHCRPTNKGSCECGAWKTGATPQSSTHSRWCAEFSMFKPQEMSEVEKCKAAVKGGIPGLKGLLLKYQSMPLTWPTLKP